MALIVFGPLVGFLLLLGKAIRKLVRRPPVDIGRWGGPARGGGPAGDREPRRPLSPMSSGAVRLPLPVPDDGGDEPAVPVHVIRGPGDGAPGHRVAS